MARTGCGEVQKAQCRGVTELCDLYLADVEAGRVLTRRKAAKKTSTIATDKGRIERHIKPLLGSMKVAAVTRDDVDVFMHAVADGKTAGKTKTAKKRGLANVRGGKGTAPNCRPARRNILVRGAPSNAT